MDEIVTNSGGSNGEWLEDSRKAQDGYDWRSKSCLPGGGDDHSKQKKQIIAFYVTSLLPVYHKEKILELHLYPQFINPSIFYPSCIP